MLNNLALKCEQLNYVLDGRQIQKEQAYDILSLSKTHLEEIFIAARILRNKHKHVITFSKKAFFNLVNLCMDSCSYCTYKAEPGQAKISMMNKKNIQELATLARKYRCTEALFVTGERPELKYKEAKIWLKENGFSTTAEYLVHASEIVLAEGLFPHTNAGNLTKSEIAELKDTNVSMGLMLENSSERLTKFGMPHYNAPSKHPKARLHVLESAGQVGMPMTTGVLVGIGETPYELIDSIFEIKKLHQKYGHIQEVILQNFAPKQDTPMHNVVPPDLDYYKLMVALCRIILPQMNIQIPPNLSPQTYQQFIDAGINDWGGISPLTSDYVNPEYDWPNIEFVNEHTKKAGFELKARFPVYPEFFKFVKAPLYHKMSQIMDKNGFVNEEYWKCII